MCEGLSGVGWALAHVIDVDALPEKPTEILDRVLTELSKPWPGEHGLLYGTAGFALYLLERLPAQHAVIGLADMIDQLSIAAESTRDGLIAWRVLPRFVSDELKASYPNGYYDLGVADGIPGIIAILCAAWSKGIRRDKVKALYEPAVQWLLNRRLQPEECATFPARVVSGAPSPPSRAGWCYGDPGVSATLFTAARVIGDLDLEAEALAIARRAAASLTPSNSGVVDAGLCHGAAGIGHIFNRFWHWTGEIGFAQAALAWLGAAMTAQRAQSPALYQSLVRKSYVPIRMGGNVDAHLVNGGALGPVNLGQVPFEWADDDSLLGGAAGVALALLAAVSHVEPNWDRALLLSPPR
jgi:hypothetical protein